jgi:hypothetical protein
LNIRVRRGNNFLSRPTALRRGNFVAIGIDKTCPGLVSCLKLNFSFQRLDLLLVQEIAVLIPVLNALLAGQHLVTAGKRRARNTRLLFLLGLTASQRDLGLLSGLTLGRNGRGL